MCRDRIKVVAPGDRCDRFVAHRTGATFPVEQDLRERDATFCLVGQQSKSLAKRVGRADAVSYIQSGNVVVTPPTSAPDDLRAWSETVVTGIAGFDVPIVLRTRRERERTVEHNPYPDTDGRRLHVVFFSRAPSGEVFDDVEIERFVPEKFTHVAGDLYLNVPNGIRQRNRHRRSTRDPAR